MLCKCKKVTYVGHVGHAVDAVCSGHSKQWHSGAVCSTQWNSGIW